MSLKFYSFSLVFGDVEKGFVYFQRRFSKKNNLIYVTQVISILLFVIQFQYSIENIGYK